MADLDGRAEPETLSTRGGARIAEKEVTSCPTLMNE